MSFGLKLPKGMLPVYSVGDEEEARELLDATCPKNGNRPDEWVSPELSREQTLERLDSFGDRLDRQHRRMKRKGRCRCPAPEFVFTKKGGKKKKA